MNQLCGKSVKRAMKWLAKPATICTRFVSVCKKRKVSIQSVLRQESQRQIECESNFYFQSSPGMIRRMNSSNMGTVNAVSP